MTDDAIKGGVSGSYIASVVREQTGFSTDTECLANFDSINTAEKVAAAAIFCLNEEIAPLMEMLGGECTYNVSGKELTTQNETVYWLISIEINIEIE